HGLIDAEDRGFVRLQSLQRALGGVEFLLQSENEIERDGRERGERAPLGDGVIRLVRHIRHSKSHPRLPEAKKPYLNTRKAYLTAASVAPRTALGLSNVPRWTMMAAASMFSPPRSFIASE